MNLIAVAALIGWIPLILWLFTVLPPRRAVITGVLVSWLFLPFGGFNVPGLPDYTKSTATSYGLLLGTFFFNAAALLDFRPRWFDLPMVVWCIAPAIASLSNNLGPYDAASAALAQTITWGLPYLIGRIYFGDPESIRELAIGLAIGGLVYVPLCLWEIRMSPRLHYQLYGFAPSNFTTVVRYGGYRPTVFMKTGLEVGLWMASASVTAYTLWRGGVVQHIRGIPFGAVCVPALIVTTILCKSTGAIGLMAMGIGVVWLTARTGWRLPFFLTLLLSPLFIASRSTEIWSARNLVDWSAQYISPERAHSLEFRVNQEDRLIKKAKELPWFGWGGWGRSRIQDSMGRDVSVTDSLWIIAFGTTGSLGLTALTLSLGLPGALLLRRSSATAWRDAEVAPAAALAVVVTLFQIDCLFNAMINPVYIMAAGAIIGLPDQWGSRSLLPKHPDLSWGDQLLKSGHPAEAEMVYQRILAAPESAGGSPGALALQAEVYSRLADLKLLQSHWDAALELAEQAVTARSALVQPYPADFGYRCLLVDDSERLARCLARVGQLSEAVSLWEQVVTSREQLVHEQPHNSLARESWARSLNDLAWMLVEDKETSADSLKQAARLAEQAVMIEPKQPTYWNTLGLSYHRLGRWEEAASALSHSTTLGGDSCRGANDLILALVWHGRGLHEQASECLKQADAWLSTRPSFAESLRRLRAEADSISQHLDTL